MSAHPPPSLLITPDVRRRLQQHYEEAVRLMSDARPDRARIQRLLADCLRTDPSNILYLNAILANLRAWHDQPKPWTVGWWWQRKSKSQPPPASALEFPTLENGADLAARQILGQSPEILLKCHRDPGALKTLAAACAVCDFEEAELRYLLAARESAPDDLEALRMLARTLTRQGQFAAAREHWDRLESVDPDEESGRAMLDLGPPETHAEVSAAKRAASADSASAAETIANAQALIARGEFSQAEQLLVDAQSTRGGDLTIRQALEDLQLAKSQHRLEISRRRAAHDRHAKSQLLVGRLAAEHLHLETEIFHVRCERFPGDSALRLELARRLKRGGNYSGAIERLEELTQLRPPSDGAEARLAAAYLELGECWQHLRQFGKALGYYREAIAAAGPRNAEVNLAHYRAGVLAAAMNQQKRAREHLAAVVAADPSFKDAREWLDKLNST